MKLNEDIARGEDERMKKLDKYPEANDGVSKVQRKLNKEKSKLSKINGSTDSLNNWKEESKSKNRAKEKPNKVKQKIGESSGLEEDSNDDVEDNEEDDDESLEHNEEDDDQSTDDNEEDGLVDDSEENNELALKLSNALKKIAPGSDDELESENDSDASQESEGGSSDDAFEEERRKRKLEMMKGMAKKNEESSEEEEEEEEDDESSSEDEFEEERRKRKMELLRLNGKLSKNKRIAQETDDDDDDGESSDEDILNESKSKQKNNVVKKNSKKTKSNKLNSNGKVKKPKQDDTKILKSTTTQKETSQTVKKETSETVKKETIKTTQKKAPVETVVDDFFMTKDNKEYLSSVKPNAAPEPSERASDGDVYKPRKPQFTDAKPKDMYRKGKKVVLNKNRASFSNFEGKSSYSRDSRPSNQPRKFNSEKTDRFGGAASFHDRRNGGRFNGKFEKPLTAGGSGEKLHPSWEAKKRHQPAITHFKGKKIKFDE